MLIHIWVLLVAFDRTQPGKLANEFLSRWRRGDLQGTLLFLQEHGLCGKERAFRSDPEIYTCFKEQLIYRCFEKMFIMIFSYLLAGAFGVLFAYVSYQLRDSHDEHQNEKQVNFVLIKNKYNKLVSLSEAVVVVKVDGEKKLSASESMDEIGSDRGPVNALSKALTKDLGSYQNLIDDIKLVDFKVRITEGGTEAMTRVVIDSEDKNGVRWSTVGVSPNIVDASFEALLDAINWKIVRDTS